MFGHFFETNGMELTDPAWRPGDGDSSDDEHEEDSQKENERAKSSAAISAAVETGRISTDLIVFKRVKAIFLPPNDGRMPLDFVPAGPDRRP